MNPYQAPPPQGQGPYDPYGAPARERIEAPSRTPFILAAVGAFCASGYWALLTLLLGFAAYTGGASGAQVIMPIVLIVLYAYRGVLVLKGDPRSARSLLALHGIGGVLAAVQLAAGAGLIVLFLQGLKVVIHIFGGIAAYSATKATPTSTLPMT